MSTAGAVSISGYCFFDDFVIGCGHCKLDLLKPVAMGVALGVMWIMADKEQDLKKVTKKASTAKEAKPEKAPAAATAAAKEAEVAPAATEVAKSEAPTPPARMTAKEMAKLRKAGGGTGAAGSGFSKGTKNSNYPGAKNVSGRPMNAAMRKGSR